MECRFSHPEVCCGCSGISDRFSRSVGQSRPGNGSILPEAVKEAGAAGTFLNHAEKPMPPGEIAEAIRRTTEVGLISLVCVASPEEAAAIARLGPDIILAEPPALIGTDQAVSGRNDDFLSRTLQTVRAFDPEILLFNSAGIRTGADGTGSTSGILKADDPVAKVREMVKAVREAWNEIH